MDFCVLSLFPEMFSNLDFGVIGIAKKAQKIKIDIVNIRDYADPPHYKCDDTPYGGGAGMVMLAEPLFRATLAKDPDRKAHRILLSPRGKTLNQQKVTALAGLKKPIMLVCGAYEGIDERYIESQIDEEISIGDYILTGGELGAQVIINSVSRYIDGVLGNADSLEHESFSKNLLEHPHYTRPATWQNKPVPEILLSGNHAKIAEWRQNQQLKITKTRRPDLLD